MSTVLLRSLPGFTFETASAPLDEALPRMDVAAFVGFAASGPIGIPVAIEQPAEFVAIFGADVTLAWDLRRGEPEFAYLAPAVRSFFRNGGRRCWVVRVAGPAIANTFALPGLAAWSRSSPGTLGPAIARTRSEGSWSDRIEVATALRSTSLPLPAVALEGRALVLAMPNAGSLVPHDLVRLTFAADGYRAFGVVDTIDLSPSGDARVRLAPVVWTSEASPPQPFLGELAPYTVVPAPTAAELLHVDLLARDNGRDPQRLERLGLAPGHPRYWGALPDDAAVFASLADPLAQALSAERRPAASGRFPLAGSAAAIDLTLPLDIGLTAAWQGPRPLTPSAAVRDGLATFDASLFLDGRLRDAGINSLMGLAEAVKYQTTRTPQLLGGIHAAMFIDEATLLAVPDAVHPAWSAVEPSTPPPAAAIPAEALPVPPCAPPPPFEVCDPGLLPAPTLHPPRVAQAIRLEWTAVAGAAEYVLEEGIAPDFRTWLEVVTTRRTSFAIYDRPPGQYAFRVRARTAVQQSAASAGQVVTIAFTPRALVQDGGTAAGPLVEVQRAMLRMCAARADMVAVLTLPESYREAEADTHLRDLTAGAIEPALSYGTLYHPWLVATDSDGGALRRVPPDGAAAGLIARRTIARGAWVAPANEPLRGVVALTPPLRRDAASRRALLNAQINIITDEPAGFVTLNADTLSREGDLRELSVRRLLILLRRRALQVGGRYVFEPNGPAFARSVQRGFEEMLGHLYERGAFAGRTAATAYQVGVDDVLNSQRSRDAGRFIVELRVAPSRPLTFLRVRLLQRGDRLSASEER